ncbi:MAG: class I SAM-dependent methyltransferase [Candidatus Krumholzibacteriia bacterium]
MPQPVPQPVDLAAFLAPLMAEATPPRAWDGAHQLPWDDPAFSERVLRWHLDPATDMASRRPELIQRHCDWLETRLGPGPKRILDVGCGPGLYLHELARRGHTGVGFDFAPAALRWAADQARHAGLDCTFFAADLKDLPPDLPARTGPCDVVTFWFGEFHSFPPAVAAAFLPLLVACLKPGGLFVLEYQPRDGFAEEDDAEWQVVSAGPFTDEPHLWLQRHTWDQEAQTEIHTHWILAPGSATLQRYVQCHQAWEMDRLVALLAGCGLVAPEFHEPITGLSSELEFPVLVTTRG